MMERVKENYVEVLYVTIWGTWCPPCLSEIPTFIDLQERYEEQGLEIIIDRSGRVLKSRNGYGYSEEWAEELEKELIQLLQK